MSYCYRVVVHRLFGFRPLLTPLFIAFCACARLGFGSDQLEFARNTKNSLEANEKEVARLQEDMITDLEVAVDHFDLKKLESTDEVVHALHPLVQELSAAAKDILNSEEAYLTALKQLHKNLSAAPTTFRDTARQFENYAAAEPFTEIKEDYLTLAESWYRMAETTERRSEAILAEGKEMTAFKKYLERSSLFLTRLDNHLSSYPDVSDEKTRQEQLERMRHYVSGFEALRSSMRRFHDKIKTAPQSPPVADPETKETAPAVFKKRSRQWPPVPAAVARHH
jgi:hypothetical protein